MRPEVGKFYRASDGHKVLVAMKNPCCENEWIVVSCDNAFVWCVDDEGVGDHDADLIEEWTDPPAPAPELDLSTGYQHRLRRRDKLPWRNPRLEGDRIVYEVLSFGKWVTQRVPLSGQFCKESDADLIPYIREFDDG